MLVVPVELRNRSGEPLVNDDSGTGGGTLGAPVVGCVLPPVAVTDAVPGIPAIHGQATPRIVGVTVFPRDARARDVDLRHPDRRRERKAEPAVPPSLLNSTVTRIADASSVDGSALNVRAAASQAPNSIAP